MLLSVQNQHHSCRPHGAPHRPAKEGEIQRIGVLLGLYRGRIQVPKRTNLALLSSNRTTIPIFPNLSGGWGLGYTRGHLGQAPTDSLLEDCCTPSTSAGRLPTQFQNTAVCPCDSQHHQAHFIWRAREVHFTGHSPRFLIKNHN